MKNKLIVVAGCSGSGKTTVAKKIFKSFSKGKAQIISLDQFYLNDAKKMPKLSISNAINFDHPKSFDWSLLFSCLKKLLNNKSAIIPQYNYVKSQRETKGILVKPTKIIILEGILSLVNQKILSLSSMKIYVETSLDECFIRRLLRDQNERKRTIDLIIKQWQTCVRPMFLQYVEPSKINADLVLPWNRFNMNGLSYLTTTIKQLLKKGE